MESYLNRPLLSVRPNFDRPTAGQLDDFTFASQGFGKATPWKITSGPKRTVSYDFIFDGRPAIGSFRRFVSDRRGRREGFWLPVYLTDYELTEPAAADSTTLSIKRVSLEDAVSDFTQFRHIVVATWDRLECYEIESVTVEDDVETITLTTPLENRADTTAICGGLMFARLRDDELTYEFSGTDVCSVKAQFVELPPEYETAHEGSAPIFLYRFTRGLTAWMFSGWSEDLSAASLSWAAADITHGEIVAGIDLYENGCMVTVATDDETHPLRSLADKTLLQETTLEIFKSDADTLAVDLTKPVYSGSIQEVTFSRAGVISMKLSTNLRVGELSGPVVQYQRTCNHDTYSTRCGLSAATFTTTGTVTALSGDPAWIEAAEFGAKSTAESDANWFALGRVAVGSEQRLCVGQDGSRLYLNAPFRNAEVGNSITALAGDDKRIGTCAAKFNNVANFLGTPWMPNKNPQFEALETPKPKGGKKS